MSQHIHLAPHNASCSELIGIHVWILKSRCIMIHETSHYYDVQHMYCTLRSPTSPMISHLTFWLCPHNLRLLSALLNSFPLAVTRSPVVEAPTFKIAASIPSAIPGSSFTRLAIHREKNDTPTISILLRFRPRKYQSRRGNPALLYPSSSASTA